MRGSLAAWAPESWLRIREDLYEKHHGNFELNFRSFDHASDYFVQYRQLISRIARRVSRKVFQREEIEEVGVFLFGSSARVEMLGESDADIMVIRKVDTPATLRFRDCFVEALKPYGFSKIDVPFWGTFDHCRAYLERSLVEANQLMECRFVEGSQVIRHQFENLRNQFDLPSLWERHLVFHYYYFNQYYLQRGRPGEPNLKYGHGGTRDFLIPIGLCQLLKGCRFTRKFEKPSVMVALETMVTRGLLEPWEAHRYWDAANFIAFLRNELLILNKSGKNRGRTFLSCEVVEQLARRHRWKFASARELRHRIDLCRGLVFDCKQECWRSLLHYFCQGRDPDWIECLQKIKTGQVDEGILKRLPGQDAILNVFAIWSVGLHGSRASPGKVEPIDAYFRQMGFSNRWEILCSLACHDSCPAETLHQIASDQGRKRGFEYVLKIIARNRNTSRETLNSIAQDEQIDFRFREPAAVRLQHGLKRALQL